MIADHVYDFFTFFRPDLVEKEDDKKGQFSFALEPFLFTVDISHMRILDHSMRSGRVSCIMSGSFI